MRGELITPSILIKENRIFLENINQGGQGVVYSAYDILRKMICAYKKFRD